MSNPFDQFATDVQAALPAAPAAPPPPAAPQPIAEAPKSVMNPPPGQMYGQPPPQGAYGAAQPYGAPPQTGYDPSAHGAAPGYGAPAPPPAAANPYGAPAGNGLAPQTMPDPSNPFGAQAPPQAASNPFGIPGEAPAPMPPPAPDTANPFGAPANPYGAPPAAPPPADPTNPYGAPPPAAAPPADPTNPYGAPPTGYPAQPGAPPPEPPNPYGAAPAPSNPYGAPAPVGALTADPSNPYGVPMPAGAPPPDPNAGAITPYTGPPPAAGPPPPGPGAITPADPWGAPPPGQPPAQQPVTDPYAAAGALVPHQPQANDPFAIFNSAPAPPPAPVAPPAPALPPQQYGGGAELTAYNQQNGPPPPVESTGSGDFFESMGFSPPPPSSAAAPPGAQPTNSGGIFDQAVVATEPGQVKSGELPPGGEWYDARIFTPTLGVMFFKPQELTDSLFLHTEKTIVDALEERPVVAFIVEGSSARSAGVELGHVLLKVNGIDVRNPKEASRLIKEGPRPLPLLFYVPSTDVVVAEGEHMVKYDTRDTTAPNSAKDWKPKYVVIGGIIAQPWMMNMYRSKSEYDIAVIETQARRPVSVKVKQFSLQGARIQNDWQGPQMVKYKNKLHPWKYVVVLPVARNPIKISSPNLSQLKPVHEGIRRVLLAQQRDRGNPHAAGPVRGSDPYGRGGSYSGGPPQQQHNQSYAQAHQPDPYGAQGGYNQPPPQQQAYPQYRY